MLGLPRGGIPVAYEVAHALDAPLDVLVVRKIGVPGHGELAMGAVASGGVRVLNRSVIASAGVRRASLAAATARETRVVLRRERLYRGETEPIAVAGRTAIVVDDGHATGATMRAAIAALREVGAASIVVAVPVASPQAFEEIGAIVDEIVCPCTPEPFYAVGAWYSDFAPTTDDEVREILGRSRGQDAGR